MMPFSSRFAASKEQFLEASDFCLPQYYYYYNIKRDLMTYESLQKDMHLFNVLSKKLDSTQNHKTN